MEAIIQYLYSHMWEFPASLPWLVVLLLGTGVYVTLRLGLVQVRKLGHALRVVRGDFDDPADSGDVTHFQALSTALSATVGIGNIAGVAIAIHYGGPGAVFWMWVTAVLGMALKYCECTLAVHYRSFDERGEVVGGPMYYIERGLGASWKPLALVFAFAGIICSFGTGNMSQANTVAVSARSDLGLASWIVGGGLMLVVGAVILGGIRSIARVSSRLAPAMALLYVTGAVVILVLHMDQVPGALATILRSAVSPEASLGGSVVGTLTVTMLWGVKRGLFSNEAGQGSAPIAHAAAKTSEPVREGLVAALEPFIDTLVVCTMTALVIVVTGVWDQKKPDIRPLSAASVRLAEAPAGASEQAIEVPLRAGVPADARLVFEINDGPVDTPRIVRAGTEEPVDGLLRYQLDSGALQVTAVDGAELTGLALAGQMLQTSSALTGWAFQKGLSPLGDWGNYLVTLCVLLFAISTIVSWSYYGDRCVAYLAGSRYVIIYRLLYLGFIWLGATKSLGVVWTFGDLALGFMAVPNLIALLLLTPKIIELSRDYFQRMKET